MPQQISTIKSNSSIRLRDKTIAIVCPTLKRIAERPNPPRFEPINVICLISDEKGRKSPETDTPIKLLNVRFEAYSVEKLRDRFSVAILKG